MWVAPQHIVDGDNAEFSTVGALGGRAHPSGYPLYVLYLRATSWLPGTSIPSMQSSVHQAELILATGRPLLVDRWQAEIVAEFPTYPFGILIRVLPHVRA